MKGKNVLLLNVGSSSIKYTVYSDGKMKEQDYIERVIDFNKELDRLFAGFKNKGLVFDAVGHRVVHGGKQTSSVRIDQRIIKEIESFCELARLHNPYELLGIKIAMEHFKVPHVAVFDTAFHTTIPEKAAIYAIPLELSKKHRIRRYGFHGISHAFVAAQAAKILRKPLSKLKLITCHLGNGCSVCAIDHGKSVETSMGFTPLEGLVMGTRSGDLDPAIVNYLEKKERLSNSKVNDLLNKRSGLLGLSGMSRDIRDLLKARSKSKQALFALDVFCHRLVKYVGAYAAVLGGVDAIVFTAGIGENSSYVRDKVLSNFGHLGLKIDKMKNNKDSPIISSTGSKVKVLVIKTDEAKMMLSEVDRSVK